MNALDNRFAFEAVLRESVAAAALKLRRVEDEGADVDSPQAAPNATTALSIFAGLGIISAIIFVTGYSALQSDAPGIWIHRLMALTIAQSIIIAAVVMKLAPVIERRRSSARIASHANIEQNQVQQRSEEPRQTPPPLPIPRQPVIGGKLAGREFLEFDDGSIEIDTLVGRRRFISKDAAREFVGA